MAAEHAVEISVRVVVDRPLPGLRGAVQLGRADLLAPSRSTPEAMTFDFTLRCSFETAGPRLLGPAAQGPPSTRFVYVNWGSYAGQANTPCNGRAKVPLSDLSEPLIRQHLKAPESCLQVRFPGIGKNGGPTYASVRFPANPWRVVLKTASE